MPSDDVENLLNLMASLPTAAPTLDALAVASGLDRDRINDVLVEAEGDGLITIWEDANDGPAIMLSSLAAGRLGLRLEEVGEAAYRWVPTGGPVPAVKNKTRRNEVLASEVAAKDQSPAEFFDMLPDPSALEAEDVAIRGEHLESLLPRVADKALDKYRPSIHQPLILVGLRPQWNAVDQLDEGRCIGCLGRTLAPMEFCCRCERSGIDALLPALPANLAKKLDQSAVPMNLAKPAVRPKGKTSGKAPGAKRVARKRGKATGTRAKAKKAKASA